MNPKLDRRFVPLILTYLVLLGIPNCVCQNEDTYRTCNQDFQCGRLRQIGYPFYGGNRPVTCGYPGFELDCRGSDPLLNISSMIYRVHDIDHSARTLRVSRNDLLDNLCPTPPINTTLNSTLFSYDSSANDQIITLYYSCTINQPWPTFLNPNYQLNCSGNSLDFFATREVSEQLNSFGDPCNSHIYVLVSETSARDLGNQQVASSDRLRSSLESGFRIQYSADNPNCGNCIRVGGLCGYNQGSASFVCHGPPNGNRNGNGSQKHVIIGVPVGLAGLIILSIIIYSNRKNCSLHNHSQESNQNVDEFLLNHGSLAPKRYSYNEIKSITKFFTDKLGQGGYGIVYKGNLPDGQLVAVKVLMETSNNAEDFINEVASISRTSHVNIVNLLGFCYDREKMALVYEFMPNKSLDKFVHKSGSSDPECSLELEKLYEIAVGVARGLEYLHRGCNTRIVHFDIKPQNILLDEDFCPKISDFGLARLFKKKQSVISTFGPRGTIGYIAPEVFFRRLGPVSHKSDVYSYGMMLLEMSEPTQNVETEAIQSSENYFPDKIYEYVLLKREKLGDLLQEEKEKTKRKMLLVGLWCIQTAPSERPSMTKVVEMLEGSIQSIQIPPKPLLSSSMPTVPQFLSSFSVAVETEDNIEG